MIAFHVTHDAERFTFDPSHCVEDVYKVSRQHDVFDEKAWQARGVFFGLLGEAFITPFVVSLLMYVSSRRGLIAVDLSQLDDNDFFQGQWGQNEIFVVRPALLHAQGKLPIIRRVQVNECDAFIDWYDEDGKRNIACPQPAWYNDGMCAEHTVTNRFIFQALI